MYKKQNARWVLRSTGKMLLASFQSSHTRGKHAAASLLLALCMMGFVFWNATSRSPHSGVDLASPDFRHAYYGIIAFVLLLVTVIPVFRLRRGEAAALRKGSAAALVEVLSRSAEKLSLFPDAAALVASRKALAYALYGDGHSASEALRWVAWSEKAPVLQAAALVGEGFIDLLCHGNAQGYLRCITEARTRATFSALVPGARWDRTRYDFLMAVGEVFANRATGQTRARLAFGLRRWRQPELRAIALYALAHLLEQQGRRVEAEEVRNVLATIAPGCAPLHAQFGSGVGPACPLADWEGPVTSALRGSLPTPVSS